MLRVAINGYGRIGRCIVRALLERKIDIELVAINDLADNALLTHLTEFDSNHGRLKQDVFLDGDVLHLHHQKIQMLTLRDASKLPWQALNIDIVLECSGHAKTCAVAQLHIDAGAKKVLVSAPMQDAQKTVVYGVNHRLIGIHDTIISNASCTTNCLSPIAQVIDSHWGLESGLMNTIHAYTNDQHLVDQAPGDAYRSRSAAMSMIPTSTGAATAVGLVLPQLTGRLEGMAVRVPTANVSVIDLYCLVNKSVSVDEVNAVMKEAADTRFEGVLAYNQKPLVSVDFNHHSASSIFDANHTFVVGQQLKVMSWYDNEWGFANRMLDTAAVMHDVGY